MEILRNIARRKLRSVLTISGIVIGVLALTTMGAIAENFNTLLDGGVKYFSSNVQVGPPDGQSASLLPISKIDEIKQVQGVATAFPSYTFSAKPGAVQAVSFGFPDLIIAGDPAENDWAALKTSIARGHQIDVNSTGQVVLGSTIDKEFKKNVGDTIDLPVRPADAKPDFINHTFTVVGILNPTLTAPDTFAYINTVDGQMLLKDSLPIAIRGQIDVSQITEAIDVYGKPGSSISDLSVVNTMFMAVAERVREIGLKKAVGATTLNIMGEFLIEATLIGLIGGLVGYGIGALITIIANATTAPGTSTLFLLTVRLTVFALGFAVALGAVAGILPAFRAARLDPVTALRNE